MISPDVPLDPHQGESAAHASLWQLCSRGLGLGYVAEAMFSGIFQADRWLWLPFWAVETRSHLIEAHQWRDLSRDFPRTDTTHGHVHSRILHAAHSRKRETLVAISIERSALTKPMVRQEGRRAALGKKTTFRISNGRCCSRPTATSRREAPPRAT